MGHIQNQKLNANQGRVLNLKQITVKSLNDSEFVFQDWEDNSSIVWGANRDNDMGSWQDTQESSNSSWSSAPNWKDRTGKVCWSNMIPGCLIKLSLS